MHRVIDRNVFSGFCFLLGLGLEPGGWGAGAGAGQWGAARGLRGAGRGCGLWALDIGLELGYTFNENSKLMKMQFKAKFTQFLFIRS